MFGKSKINEETEAGPKREDGQGTFCRPVSLPSLVPVTWLRRLYIKAGPVPGPCPQLHHPTPSSYTFFLLSFELHLCLFSSVTKWTSFPPFFLFIRPLILSIPHALQFLVPSFLFCLLFLVCLFSCYSYHSIAPVFFSVIVFKAL